MNHKENLKGGGYVLNERNQFQENSRILIKASERRDPFKGMVHDC